MEVMKVVTEADSSSVRWSKQTFTPLPRRGRVALLVLLGIVLATDLVVYLTDPATTIRDATFGVLAILTASLYAWRPAAASLGLLLIALVQTTAHHDGSQFLYLAAFAGVVVYTSPTWFSAAYICAASALVIPASSTPGELANSALLALALVFTVSMSIGGALSRAHEHENRLARDIVTMENARAAEMKAERDRISDELHDIIAHDVTLISMHVRVLERVDDRQLRDQSVRAIRYSADQALADIRRVLRIVRDDQSAPREGVKLPAGECRESISSALNEARNSLLGLGARVTVEADAEMPISNAIEKTIVQVLREGTTNIVKHGSLQPVVRISLTSIDEEVCLEIVNSISDGPDTSIQNVSGYGLARLDERVTLLGGHLIAEADATTWRLAVRLPKR